MAGFVPSLKSKSMATKSSKLKWILSVGVIIALIGATTAYYQFNKPHRDPSQEEAKEHISANDLKQEFLANPELALGKYIDKVIAVKGSATEVSDEAIILSDAVYCVFETKTEGVVGSEIIVKGRVVSYDDLFEQVRLDFCTLQP